MQDIIEADFIIPLELGSHRVDQAVAQLFPEHSRSRIQSWIKDQSVTVNGTACKPKDKVHPGDVININATIESQHRWEPQAIELDIVYEDDHIMVINKPAGLVVHPAAGHADGTLVNAVLHHAPGCDQIPRAGIVHRLDKDTSGLMVVAKSLIAHTSLVNQLQQRSMGREYEAIATGELTGGGKVDAAIARHSQNRKKMAVHANGKPAVTHYRIVQRFPGFTHLRLKLETGRTHQIRVHMAHIQYPLVGDPVYGGRIRLPKGATEEIKSCLQQFNRQALHAAQLTLIHPESGEEMSWQAPMPEDMQSLLKSLQQFADEQSLG